jgi:hypothetical protein
LKQAAFGEGMQLGTATRVNTTGNHRFPSPALFAARTSSPTNLTAFALICQYSVDCIAITEFQ